MSSDEDPSCSSGNSSEWEIDNEEEERIVVCILNKRKREGRTEYLVHWKDSPDDEDSWESQENLRPRWSGLILEYEKERQKTKKRAAKRNKGKKPGPSPSVIAFQEEQELIKEKEKRRKRKERFGSEAAAASSSSSRNYNDEQIPPPELIARFDGENHPLLNPVVLTNLFKLCPRELLHPSLFVGKAWFENSHPIWRSSGATLTFAYPKDGGAPKRGVLAYTDSSDSDDEEDHRLEDYSDSTYSSNSKRLRRFINFWEKECMSKPYQQFHLKNWKFDPINGCTSSSRRPVFRFWDLIQGNLTTLKLSDCRFKNLETFRKILFQSCPNLRDLTLENCSVRGLKKQQSRGAIAKYSKPICGERTNLKSLSISSTLTGPDLASQLPQLELLSHFPALTSFQLSYHEGRVDYDKDDFRLWLNSIKLIRNEDNTKLCLKRFDVNQASLIISGGGLDGGASLEFFKIVQELNIPIQSLNIQSSSKVTSVRYMLSSHGSSLHKIEAVKMDVLPWVHVLALCDFPFGMALDNLAELVIWSDFSKNMGFIKVTPNLKKLHVIERWNSRGNGHFSKGTQLISRTNEANVGDAKLLKLKELWIGYTLMGGDDDVRKLCDWMPNVEILTMFLDNEKFAVVCERWGKLRHVHALGFDVPLDDGGIIGMALEDSERSRIRPNANITFLKDLICFQFSCAESRLTDASVYNGFLKLPNLKILGCSRV